jgi:hypothetical protein
LQEAIDNPVSEFRELYGRPLAIPSVASILLYNSEGKPEKFIEEALKLREKTVAIRKGAAQWLSDFDNDFNGLINTSKKVAELSSILRMELGLDKSLDLLDAIEIQMNFVVPTCKFNVGKIRDWTRYVHNKKKYVVLTDMSKAAAFASSSNVEKAYRKLCRF